jgi:hypothetical protein
MQMFSVGCLWPGFHASLLLACLIPFVAALVFAIIAVIYKICMNKDPLPVKNHFLKIFLMFMWCFFPFVCFVILSAFNCEKFDNGDYLLQSDFSVHCDSDAHRNYKIVAGLAILVYPVGVPLLFLWCMWPYRHEFADVATRESSFAKGGHLAFFVADFTGDLWYFEILELLRKLLLNGFAILISPGSLMQLVLAMIVSLFYFALVLHLQPMQDLTNNYFVAFISLMQMFIYMISMLMKIKNGSIHVAFSFGYNSTVLLVTLFITSIGVLVTGAVLLLHDIEKGKSEHLIRCVVFIFLLACFFSFYFFFLYFFLFRTFQTFLILLYFLCFVFWFVFNLFSFFLCVFLSFFLFFVSSVLSFFGSMFPFFFLV